MLCKWRCSQPSQLLRFIGGDSKKRTCATVSYLLQLELLLVLSLNIVLGGSELLRQGAGLRAGGRQLLQNALDGGVLTLLHFIQLQACMPDVSPGC